MNKTLGICVAALLFASASTAVLAAEPGSFFINGNLGQSNYQNSFFRDRTDTAAAVRAGYAWQNDAFDFGLEAGYVDLGKASANLVTDGLTQHVSLKATGPLLGANFKYKFQDRMFLAARAGWFRSKLDFDYQYNFGGASHSGRNGTYAGATFGYDVAPHFSLGVSADHYEARARIDGFAADEGVNMYSVFAEYRF
jgi:OOP family OmpA-OmpF porin